MQITGVYQHQTCVCWGLRGADPALIDQKQAFK